MSDFVGKSVIVTGSSSGIGEGTAVMFAGRGANVTICGRNETNIQNVLGKCQTASKDAGHESKFLGVAGDVTDSAHRQEIIDKTVAAFGKLDVLVVNHGVGKFTGSLDEVTEEIYDYQFNINTKASLFLIQAAVKHLEKTKGSIVVTSSIVGTVASDHMTPYYMSKAAVEHMVRCLALELGPKGIRINAIKPTIVNTQLLRDSEENFFESEAFRFFAKSHPLGGKMSTPDEQADVIAFLASEAARFITGECLSVDGGVSIRGHPMNYFTPASNSTAETEK